MVSWCSVILHSVSLKLAAFFLKTGSCASSVDPFGRTKKKRRTGIQSVSRFRESTQIEGLVISLRYSSARFSKVTLSMT